MKVIAYFCWIAFLGWLFCLLAGCDARDLPRGEAMSNQEPAIQFALGYYFAPEPAAHAPVAFVEPTCAMVADGPLEGFLVEGRCLNGLTVEGNGSFVARGARYSATALCHELMHALIGDGGHSSVEAWGAPAEHGFGGQVGGCMRALALHSELDEAK